MAGQRALSIAIGLGDFALQASANYYLGEAYHVLGDYRRAADFLRHNVESFKSGLIRERFGMAGPHSVISRAWLVMCLAELGEFAEGMVRGEEGLRIAEAVEQPFSLVLACYAVGSLSLRKGDLNRAISVLERGLPPCQSVPYYFPWIASALGYAYALSGRVAEALSLQEQAVQQAASMGIMQWQSCWAGWLGEAYLLAGRRDDAIRFARRALDLSRNHKERGHEAWALRLLGEIASHPDPPDVETAEGHYRQAMTLAGELDMRPLLAHCHLGLGRLFSKVGRHDEARSELAAATDLYRSMDMTFWLPQAEGSLGKASG